MDDLTIYENKIRSLENKVDELEEELKSYKDLLFSFAESKQKMIGIIGIEIRRLEERVKDNLLDGREIKKFDTLVKDYDILTKDVRKKIEEEFQEDENIAELLSIVRASNDDD